MAGAQAHIRTFTAPLQGPGRTAPSFAEDLTLYDPLHLPPSGINILRDPPLTDGGVQPLDQILPAGSCQHAFCTKDRQSQLPSQDARPQQNTLWKVSAMCRKCRLHMDLCVDYSIRWESQPCPNEKSPLHHLVHSPWRESLARSQWRSHNPGSQDEIYTFECSSNTCSATVTVHLRPPILGAEAVHILTDQELLKKRVADAIAWKPALTEGMRHPSVTEVLSDLRAYMKNTFTKEHKPIQLTNKRFLSRFGREGLPCKDVLEYLGFTYKAGEYWEPPRPDLADAVPFNVPLNIYLDNALIELSALILQRPNSERQTALDSTTLIDSSRDIARALSCQDYDRDPKARIALRDTPASGLEVSYRVLGIPEVAAHQVVIFALHQQIKSRPSWRPWFLTHFREIANRATYQSEEMNTELAMQSSQGWFDAEQLQDAHQYFGLKIDNTFDDDHIIGIFRSRIQDSPRQEAEMREQLRIIGVQRGSSKIMDTASDTLNTYEQALAFFNAEPTTADDFIVTLFTTKTAEDSSARTNALKAVSIIAEHRNSKGLRQWLDTGHMGDFEMDIGEAYSLLNISDRTIDDDFIMMSYESAITDKPENVETYNRAIRAIADAKKSSYLQQRLQGGQVEGTKASADRPVGLENIGNTCYLNSLLQYFFTNPELRNIVLDFDKYKQGLSAKEMKSKKVGRLDVNTQQVITAQKFVFSLASLFREMITSPDASITPKQELARLTLESKGAVDKVRRRSTIASGGRPSLGQIDSMPLLGPLGPPMTDTNEALEGAVVQSPTVLEDPSPTVDPTKTSNGNGVHTSEEVDMVDANDNSSEITLVSNTSKEESNGSAAVIYRQQQGILDNKENLAPVKEAEGIRRSASPDKQPQPLGLVSDSTLNVQAGALASMAQDHETMKDAPAKDELPKAAEEAPKKPPPIPPRPQNNNAIPMLEEYARQQDVTEVIGHCLYQFSLAIRPLSHDKDGEQLDEIHNMFYGQQVSHISPGEPDRNTYELFSNILTRVSLKPEDIYAALDGYFDIEEVEKAKRYVSITKLPPILAIQLDRVQYDKVTNTVKKLNHHVELKETIYLDRYLEDIESSALTQRREQTWEMKKKLAQMLERKEELEETDSHPCAGAILEDARIALMALQTQFPNEEDEELLEIKPSTIEKIDALSQMATTELAGLSTACNDLNMSVSSNFTDMRKHGYHLHAAFFHRGTPGSGHYWVYLYDFKNEIWRKYNDGYVTDVTDTKEIFAQPSLAEMNTWNGPPNPYFVVYVRDDLKDTLVECVKREIIERPPAKSQMSAMPPNEDFEMTDIVPSTSSKRFALDEDNEGPNPMLEPLL